MKIHMWNFTRQFSPEISDMKNWTNKYHIRLFTSEISHVTIHIWNFPCEISHVKFPMWNFTCEYHLWNFTCETRVKSHMWNFTCETLDLGTCVSHVKTSHVILELHMWNTCAISVWDYIILYARMKVMICNIIKHLWWSVEKPKFEN